MSSRFQGKCVLNSTTKSKEERRNIHSLLRLDSTGEVSSDSYINCQQCSNMCLGNLNCTNCQRNQKGVRQKIGGFNMNSMIGKASTYFGTASSYISGFCPYKTAKGLVRNNSFTSDSNIDTNKICDNTIAKMAIGTQCEQSQSNMQNSARIESPIKGFPSACQVLGVLQSSIVKSNNKPVGNMTKVEPYRPPHMKGKLMQEPLGGSVSKVNPKLTPYNARLLENSRKTPQQFSTETKTVHSAPYMKSQLACDRKISGEVNCKTTTVENRLKDRPAIPVESEKSVTCVKQEMARQDDNLGENVDCDINAVRMADTDSSVDVMQPTTVVPEDSSENMESKVEDDRQPCPDISETKTGVTDWFEYESTASKTIPIKLPLQHNNNVNLNTELEQPQGKTSSLLHSWFSMDLDVDIKKQQLGHNSSQNEVEEQCKCNEKLDADSKQRIPASKSGYEKTDNGKSEINSTVAPTPKDLVSVLYIRDCHFSKKGRPSSKKRRRQKAQQNESPENNECKNKKVDEPTASDPKKNSSISFILGLNSENSDDSRQSHSFLMTCDMDSDIDWSDDSDLETDGLPECHSNGATVGDFDQFQDCLGLVNFQVTCSVQSPKKTSESNDELDAVNFAWNVHIRQVDHSPTQKKTTSSKKVHFPEAEHLAEVHTEVEWSDEYQAARKGPWEEYARDRERFRRRVTDTESQLQQVFNHQHRDRIYQDRFSTVE